ncbi:hypothetical protein HAU32_03260 [Weissella confusa]|uniref:Carboxypeptidase regulatory-like domain-containing protein n=1 Tax=Weissella fermenti TaxID=2987699 RepID=A0ABT6D095_9LACO|nr:MULTISPECIES: hypothetical protein [Weissella]MBJ7687998.1 hypothetical protein [Weissella confusa]MCW0926428.1 hypothetical protein [Weissella sp. LMG 11983]MDF9298851.1 hypothetical protein [Weissella sp. BK2]
MNDTKVNLVASTLTNSLGTTVIGHATPASVINVKYPNGKYDSLVSDENGEFIAKAPSDLYDGDIIVEANLPGNPASQERVVLTIDLPAPVITAVISTQGDKRLLEGRVNQLDVDVTVKLAGSDEDIFLLVDKGLEFELELPADTVPSQVEVRAKSRRSGKDGVATVSVGVTTKTLTMPALTDEMIAEYVAQEKAAKEANEAANAAIEADKQPKPFEPAAETTPVDIPEEPVSEEESRVVRQHEKSSGLFGFFSKLFGGK